MNTDKATKDIKILVVDDDAINADVIEMFLTKDYTVNVAHNAKEALEFGKQNNYDLVLMDINLGKGLSGIDILKNFKSMDSFINIPIIAVTAFAMRGDKESFLEDGFDDYLSKPFSKESLLSLVKSRLP